MQGAFVFSGCLLTTAMSHSVQAPFRPDGTLYSLIGTLTHDLSATAQKGLSVMENYASEAVEKMKQT